LVSFDGLFIIFFGSGPALQAQTNELLTETSLEFLDRAFPDFSWHGLACRRSRTVADHFGRADYRDAFVFHVVSSSDAVYDCFQTARHTHLALGTGFLGRAAARPLLLLESHVDLSVAAGFHACKLWRFLVSHGLLLGFFNDLESDEGREFVFKH
jgi:hypothetical protein